MKCKNQKKIQIEFDYQHIPVHIYALEIYSRLQSGQVAMAIDTVYVDRNLSWDERNHIERTIRHMVFLLISFANNLPIRGESPPK